MRAVVYEVARRATDGRVTAEALFRALVACDAGRKALFVRGVAPELIDAIAAERAAAPAPGAPPPQSAPPASAPAAAPLTPPPAAASAEPPSASPPIDEAPAVLSDDEIDSLFEPTIETAPTPVPAAPPAEALVWRGSPSRERVLQNLSSVGRVLTTEAESEPDRGITGIDAPLKALMRTLAKMRRHNAIVLGFPGTGKSAFIQEVARRIVMRHPSIPRRVQDMDIFELSPAFLRSGASGRGEYEERVKKLLEILIANPAVILFVDEIHSLIRSGMHERSSFGDGDEAFKAALGRGEVNCIGCTTPAEYRYYIEPDAALVRRFSLIRLDPPTREATAAILRARRPRVEAHFAPLRIPDEMLDRTIALSEEYLPSRYQPDKSIQLLDEGCATCATEEPPLPELTEDALRTALGDMLGRGIVDGRRVSEAGVMERLKARLIGQDDVLRQIARSFVAGLGEWVRSEAPRGVFVFAGPTGVGKTEAAVILADILGNGSEGLLRIDCSTLQGQGNDGSPSVYRLLGVPPPYLGYVRGKGGLLSQVRDLPEAVILFDEFEKAHPDVGRLLLRILDEGAVEDADGNTLDFRRSFFIFTTNAGVSSGRQSTVGFTTSNEPDEAGPRCDATSVMAALKDRGIGEEFLGRLNHVFVFQALGRETMRQVVEMQLRSLAQLADSRGLHFDWDEDVVPFLTTQWQPRFGARALATVLRNRITEQLSVAEAQGEMTGIEAIRIRVMSLRRPDGLEGLGALACREREGAALVISLA